MGGNGLEVSSASLSLVRSFVRGGGGVHDFGAFGSRRLRSGGEGAVGGGGTCGKSENM